MLTSRASEYLLFVNQIMVALLNHKSHFTPHSRFSDMEPYDEEQANEDSSEVQTSEALYREMCSEQAADLMTADDDNFDIEPQLPHTLREAHGSLKPLNIVGAVLTVKAHQDKLRSELTARLQAIKVRRELLADHFLTACSLPFTKLVK